jgi:hypothetical protein
LENGWEPKVIKSFQRETKVIEQGSLLILKYLQLADIKANFLKKTLQIGLT